MRMDGSTWDALVSDLYLSALDVDAAARVPGHLAALTGGVTVSCWRLRPRDLTVLGVLASNVTTEGVAAYQAHYHRFDPWQPAVQAARFNTVLHGAETIDESTLARSMFYNEFGAEYGIFHHVAALVPMGGGTDLTVGCVAIQRPRELGGFDVAAAATLERLLPHLTGAFRLRDSLDGRVATVQLVAIDAALDALGAAALVTDGQGAIVRANAAAQALPPIQDAMSNRSRHDGLLRLPPGPARDRLARLLAAVVAGEPGGSCYIPGRAGARGFLLTIAPLPSPLAALSGTAAGRALVVLRPLDLPRPLPSRAVAAFGLTEAEAAVAVALASGESPAEIAERRGSKISTVRTLLSRALDKTDSRNLRDLVRTVLALG